MTFRGPFPPQTLCDPMKSKNNTEIKNVPNQAFPERQLSFSKILPSLRSTLCLKLHENTLSWKPAKIHRSLSTFQQKGPSSSHLAAQGVITTTAQQGGSTGASSSPQSPSLPSCPAPAPCHMVGTWPWCQASLRSHPMAASLTSHSFCSDFHIHYGHTGEIRAAKPHPFLPFHGSAPGGEEDTDVV